MPFASKLSSNEFNPLAIRAPFQSAPAAMQNHKSGADLSLSLSLSCVLILNLRASENNIGRYSIRLFTVNVQVTRCSNLKKKLSEEKQGIPEISLFEICYSSFFGARKKAEENAPAKPWSPRGEGLGTTPIFLTTPTSPSACNHASYHRVQIETLPFCCPRPSPYPLPLSSSSDFSCPGLFAGKPRRRAPWIYSGRGMFPSPPPYLRRPRRRVGFLQPLYRLYTRVTLYHSSAGLLSFRVMVYARVRTQVRRSHFLGRVGGWKAGNNPARARAFDGARPSSSSFFLSRRYA